MKYGDRGEPCGIVNSLHGYVCGRDAGHDGPHIEFRADSTVAWPQS